MEQDFQNRFKEACKFGFLDDKEFVPKIFANLKKENIAKVFLTLYNANVDDCYKIPPKFAKNCVNLKQIFLNFINFNLEKKPLNFTKATKFCVASNVVIFGYLQRKHQPNLANFPEFKLAKVILLLRSNFNFGIILPADLGFENLIFDKVSCKNKNCKVLLEDDIIVIEKNGFRLGILPNFREITSTNCTDFNDDIKRALLRNFSLDTLYLVYPRTKYFRRHIEVKSCEFAPNFTMKLVPYSINNKIY